MHGSGVMTVGELAAHFSVKPWQIRRVFEDGRLPPAPRVGAYRVVAIKDLPKLERALRQAGYIGAKREPAHAG